LNGLIATDGTVRGAVAAVVGPAGPPVVQT
jgi:hypothetical protein